MATLTLAGMSKLQPDIWNLFSLPDPLDNQLAINVILNHCGNNEIRYPDDSYLGFYIGVWCSEHSTIFQKLYNTTVLEYNPIHNYNMNDEIVETPDNVKDVISRTGKRILDKGNTNTTTKQIGMTETPSGTKTNTRVTNSISGTSQTTVEHQVSAYNVSTYQPHSKDITTTNTFPTMQDKDTEAYDNYKITKTPTSGQDTVIDKGNETETWDGYTETHSHEGTKTTTEAKSGNIGVTTTQKMINEEREVAMFNIYRTIAHMFEDDFTVCVY